MDLEFFVDFLEVEVDCAGGDAQFGRGGLVIMALDQQFQR
jgi:hypothetical protein